MPVRGEPLVIGALHVGDQVSPPPPAGLIPADVEAVTIPQEGLPLHLISGEPFAPTGLQQVLLRVTVAGNHRGRTVLSARDAQGAELGRCLIWAGGQFQPFDIPVHTFAVATLHAEGDPVWLIVGGPGWEHARPHLRLRGDADREAAALDVLCAPHCLQPFGWKDGCLTDALADLARATGETRYAEALQRRLRRYVPDGHLRYDYQGTAWVDGFHTIESGLPVAALMDLPGGEILPDLVLRFWQACTQADGTIGDGGHLSTEGCYTIAWPLARIARQRQDADLALRACAQVRVRRQGLRVGDSVYQSNPERLPGWARGVAWYLLGQARTLGALSDWIELPADLTAELARTCHWIASWQRRDGLWGNFVDDPTSGVDTSGSAGIATGLAHAVALGLADGALRAAVEHAAAGLATHLTDDGWLGGCAQENKGGEALQRSDYRVCAPFGLGLWGQLQAIRRDPGIARP